MPSFTSLLRGTVACLVLCTSAFAAVDRILNGVQLNTGQVNVKVEFYSPTTVRVIKWPVGGNADKLSLSVIQKDVPALPIQIGEANGIVTLSSAQVRVELNTANGTLRYLDAKNRPILAEQSPATFTPTGLPQEKAAFSIQQNFTLTARRGHLRTRPAPVRLHELSRPHGEARPVEHRRGHADARLHRGLRPLLG